jgi:fucose 4-O-acetylase-like acetyltransferase
MFFKKKKESHTKKIDKLVTGLIIWWAVASMVWFSRTKKWKEITQNVKKESRGLFSKAHELFWKSLVIIISIFDKKNK